MIANDRERIANDRETKTIDKQSVDGLLSANSESKIESDERREAAGTGVVGAGIRSGESGRPQSSEQITLD